MVLDAVLHAGVNLGGSILFQELFLVSNSDRNSLLLVYAYGRLGEGQRFPSACFLLFLFFFSRLQGLLRGFLIQNLA